MKRAIHLFPEFNNLKIIESLRMQYDPLFGLIPPHITLVFPFESHISSQILQTHILDALKGITQFPIKLQDFTGTVDQYLFLNVKKGNDQIIELHDRLYSGLLSSHRNQRFSFYPHLTIGKFTNEETLMTALTEANRNNTQFETIISKIFIESIDESGYSTIEFVISI